MESLTFFVLALAAIFAVPGPTNAMLLVSGAQRGFVRALPVVGATLSAYIPSVALQYFFGSALIAELTAAAQFIKLALAAYLLVIAWQTWKFEMERSVSGVGLVKARQLFFVTAINPKTVIIAFAIFPPRLPADDLVLHGAIFVVMVSIACCLWAFAGSLLKRLPNRANALPVFRALAVGLGALSAVLSVMAFRDLVA
jgi:threonine/homoserine/homoserine lactone efflux protein